MSTDSSSRVPDAPRLTVVGTYFSTFSRSITLGLRHKGLAYSVIDAAPQSNSAKSHHPFGYLPTLVIHAGPGSPSGDKDIHLRESGAIVRWIDRIAPSPRLHLTTDPETGLAEGGILEEKMWELVSLLSFFGYPIIEIDVIKIRVAAMDAGELSESEIVEKVANGVKALREFLTLVESLMAPSGYAFGEKLTWADFFLYPLLADLEVTKEGEVMSERLKGWSAKMKELKEVQETERGTLAQGARPGKE